MAEELKALDVESSKVIDLEKFVPRCDIDPVYFDSPYYLYPDSPIAVETLRVIGAAIAEAGGCRDRAAHAQPARADGMVEPRGTGMALFTLRATNEVRASQFGSAESEPRCRDGGHRWGHRRTADRHIRPNAYRDRYQEALRELIEAKMKGLTIKPRAVSRCRRR